MVFAVLFVLNYPVQGCSPAVKPSPETSERRFRLNHGCERFTPWSPSLEVKRINAFPTVGTTQVSPQ